MFTGFTEETFSFFMAIGFNNNRAFFQENRDWYLRAVREPLLALADALSGTARDIDPLFETRPGKVISRINRDVRFSRDKSPYRDYMYLAFRRPGEEKGSALGLFFDFSAESASYGAGFYSENVPVMNALRTVLRNDPARARLELFDFALEPTVNKRIPVPDAVPEALRQWYPLKGFYVQKEITDFELLKSDALADEIAQGWKKLAPMVRFFQELVPEEKAHD